MYFVSVCPYCHKDNLDRPESVQGTTAGDKIFFVKACTNCGNPFTVEAPRSVETETYKIKEC